MLNVSIVACVICGLLLYDYTNGGGVRRFGGPLGLHLAYVVVTVATLVLAGVAAGQESQTARDLLRVAQLLAFVGVVGTYAALRRADH